MVVQLWISFLFLEQGNDGFKQTEVPLLVRKFHMELAQKIAQNPYVKLPGGISGLDWQSQLSTELNQAIAGR